MVVRPFRALRPTKDKVISKGRLRNRARPSLPGLALFRLRNFVPNTAAMPAVSTPQSIGLPFRLGTKL